MLWAAWARTDTNCDRMSHVTALEQALLLTSVPATISWKPIELGIVYVVLCALKYHLCRYDDNTK